MTSPIVSAVSAEKRLLLTGGCGFVGSHVRSHDSTAVAFERDGAPIDIRQAEQVREGVAQFKPSSVIHLAAITHVPAAEGDPRLTFDVNFYGTFNLLQALKQNGFTGRMLYVGSSEMYGVVPPESLPIRESLPLRPRNLYGVSKVAAEALCYEWSQSGPFEIVLTRPFVHIGPGQGEEFVVSSLARQLVEVKRGLRPPVIHVGDIDVTRDFTDVRDVVRAYELLLAHGNNGCIYNVCSGVERSVRSVLEQMMELAGVEAEIRVDASRVRRSEQRRAVGSFELLHRDTGWQPQIPLQTTLISVLEDWDRRLS